MNSEEIEIIGTCPICGELIYEDDEVADDDTTYEGLCHEECYYEAQESRLS